MVGPCCRNQLLFPNGYLKCYSECLRGQWLLGSHLWRNYYLFYSKVLEGVLFVAQHLMNPTRIHEDVGLIPGLTQWVKHLPLL